MKHKEISTLRAAQRVASFAGVSYAVSLESRGKEKVPSRILQSLTFEGKPQKMNRRKVEERRINMRISAVTLTRRRRTDRTRVD